ncbi:lytic polysaccharide monooxygenase [Dactylosporangium sp. NPDC000521]|uniref:lytic polysaccharide monooxygenase n=1 Tax=Dactylosporangium sp. NPDC000521 TaxID=3363975 RepID=UPI003687EF03
MLVAIMPTNSASAHAWINSPGSRSEQCRLAVESFCGVGPKYTPQGAEAPKGSMLCSGGNSQYTALDDPNKGWKVYNIGSTATFNWHGTALHRTSTYEYFVDGRLFATFNMNGAAPPVDLAHTLTGLPSGRHLILSRWNVYDTINAFYQCVDVNVGGGTNPPTTPPPTTQPPTPTPTPTPTTQPPPSGTWAPYTNYVVGNVVTYNGLSYRCVLNHTSLPGWEPGPATATLWQRV